MTEASEFVFDGNLLCLDFMNTQMMSGGEMVDRLTGVESLMRWLCEAGVLQSVDAEVVMASWSEAEGASVLRKARGLRAALRLVLEEKVAGRVPEEGAMRRLVGAVNDILAAAPVVSSIQYDGGEVWNEERVTGDDPWSVLAGVAGSVRELLVDGLINDVGQCSDPTCVIFFHDGTKNHSRRWCSMARCGTRAKVAAYRRRARAKRAGE